MKISRVSEHLRCGPARTRFYRYSALVLATFLIVGCSGQPMTLDQELKTAAIAGGIGAVSGAGFAYASGKSYPVSILIGAAGMAGIVLLYEEIKREAALQSMPPVPNPSASSPAPSNQNP